MHRLRNLSSSRPRTAAEAMEPAASPTSSSLPAPAAKPPTHLSALPPAVHATSPKFEKKLPYKSQTTPVRERKPSRANSAAGKIHLCYFVLARSAGGLVPLNPPAYFA